MSAPIDIPGIPTIKPKSISGRIGHHHYTLAYDPNSTTPETRWHWHVRYTRYYDYYGSAETETKARNAAERKITHEMDYQRSSGI